jgi:uncharacterized phage protein (TIGR02220 family)
MATNQELWSLAVEILGTDDLSRRYRAWITNLIRTARRKAMNATPDALFDADCQAILDDLNNLTKSRYQLTDSVRAQVRTLTAMGYVVDDFLHVNAAMTALWLAKPEMAEYLRPSTLYRVSHFDEYLANWYRTQRLAADLQSRRAAAVASTRAKPAELRAAASDAAAASADLAASLAAHPWHSFSTWAEFVKHTCQFPDAAALAKYMEDIPARIQRMRAAPRMATMVITGVSPAWAEEEYAELRKSAKLPGATHA